MTKNPNSNEKNKPEPKEEFGAISEADQEPEKPLLHLHLGKILQTRGKLEEALSAYKRAQDLDPSDPEIYYAIGLLLEEMGNPESTFYIEKAIELTGSITGGGAKRKGE